MWRSFSATSLQRTADFLARNPVVFVLLPLIVSLLLGLGLLSLEYEQRVERLYTPMGSQAFKDQEFLHDFFPDRTRDAYYSHQLLYLPTFGEIIITASDGGNVLRKDVLADVRRVVDDVKGMTIDEDGRGHVYADLCAQREGLCIVDGEPVLEAMADGGCLDSNMSTVIDATGYEVNIHRSLGDVSRENHCIQVSGLIL